MIDFIRQLLKSKTMIVNILTVVAGVLVYLTNHEIVAQNTDIIYWLGVALAGVNVVLRFFTVMPVMQKRSINDRDW